jgi:hypothetical protein
LSLKVLKEVVDKTYDSQRVAFWRLALLLTFIDESSLDGAFDNARDGGFSGSFILNVLNYLKPKFKLGLF